MNKESKIEKMRKKRDNVFFFMKRQKTNFKVVFLSSHAYIIHFLFIYFLIYLFIFDLFIF
jgi:hypothetical protein